MHNKYFVRDKSKQFFGNLVLINMKQRNMRFGRPYLSIWSYYPIPILEIHENGSSDWIKKARRGCRR